MKYLMLSFLMIAGTIIANAQNGVLTPQERKFAVDYFQKTKNQLQSDVNGLSNAQLNYKTDTSRWSVAQCVEHIALSENGLWQWCMGALKNDTSSIKKPEQPVSDEQIIAMVTDRSHKMKAPETLQPKNQFPDETMALAAFIHKREELIHYILTTQDPLRTHYMQTPAGVIDVYQGLLLLAAHSARHTLQLEEVKNSPNFPKK